MNQMEWKDVHDPENRFLFDIENSIATTSYSAEEIQNLINKIGVQEMVVEVNNHFRKTHHRTAFKFGHIDGKDAVVSSVI